MIQIFLVVILVALDQLIKYVCVQKLIAPITIIPHFIELLYVENRGAAFGIMENNKIFLLFVPMLLIIGMILYYLQLSTSKADKINKIGLLLIISGAIGNLIDRIFRGYVVDMFHFTLFEFPVFNFADILVVCGAFIIIFSTFLYDEK